MSRPLSFIDRAAATARFIAETIAEHLIQLRKGIIRLRNQLAQLCKD